MLLVDVPTTSGQGYLAYLDAATAIAAADGPALAEATVMLRDNAVRSGDAALAVLSRVVEGVSALLKESRAHERVPAARRGTAARRGRARPARVGGRRHRIVLDVGTRQADHDHVVVWGQSMRRWCDMTGVAQELIRGPRP